MKKPSRKQQLREEVRQQHAVTVGQVLVEVGAELRELMMKGGLAIAAALFTEEIAQLCGPRYGRGEGLASRWGTRQGEVVLGGRKVRLPRPRVRQEGQEVELETYRQLQAEDPLNERALEQMLVGVSTRKYARSLEPLPTALDENVNDTFSGNFNTDSAFADTLSFMSRPTCTSALTRTGMETPPRRVASAC